MDQFRSTTQQLGLKMGLAKGLLEVLLIDSAEQPAQN
jgi:uncharacterized protein (TIGR03435 family)